MWLYPLLLAVPNAALCLTEHYSMAAALTNVLLPLGVYLLLCAASANTGRTMWLCLPLSIYAAFQIVLLYLYGESIIAIDMFLNVATTNFGEATELLANLTPSIILVVVLYAPPLTAGAVAWWRHERAEAGARRTARICGAVCCIAGAASMATAYASAGNYAASRQLFPVNVAYNTLKAVERYHTTRNYPESSAAYTFGAASTRPDSLREVYVLVVGETCRADNWQLLGYDRPTNPRLSQRSGVIAFPKVLSESNTTHKSVPLMLSPLSAETFGDSIYNVKSIFGAFKEAGYETGFFSNQQRNGSFIDFFGEQADDCRFIADDPAALRSDSALVPMLSDFINGAAGHKIFVVLHSYGSHFDYSERYDSRYRRFVPDTDDTASRTNRAQLVNAYDNTIVMTDAFVDDVIAVLAQLPDSVASAMLFVPDHGEDIFDDDRERFLHASPTPTYWQIHVPMVMWMSPAYRSAFPEKHMAAMANRSKNIASSRSVFDTVLSVAGITSAHSRPTRAITESTFREEPRTYLNDYNEGLLLDASGLHSEDFEMLARKDISVH